MATLLGHDTPHKKLLMQNILRINEFHVGEFLHFIREIEADVEDLVVL